MSPEENRKRLAILRASEPRHVVYAKRRFGPRRSSTKPVRRKAVEPSGRKAIPMRGVAIARGELVA